MARRRFLAEIEAGGHFPRFSRRQAGFTALAPARPIYQSRVTCECGWTYRGQAGYTKRDAEADHREHLREMDLPTEELYELLTRDAVKRDEGRAEAIRKELKRRKELPAELKGASKTQLEAFRLLRKVGHISTPTLYVGDQLHAHGFRTRVPFQKLVDLGVATQEYRGGAMDRYERFELKPEFRDA